MFFSLRFFFKFESVNFREPVQIKLSANLFPNDVFEAQMGLFAFNVSGYIPPGRNTIARN